MKWQRLIPVVLIAGLLAYLILGLPGSFSTDLEQIGDAPVTVVAIHDVNLVASTHMMDLLDRIHSRYDERVRFLVANVNNPRGRAFADTHSARPGTLVLFDSEGEIIELLRSPLDDSRVAQEIERALPGK